jgi:hypothetical protein
MNIANIRFRSFSAIPLMIRVFISSVASIMMTSPGHQAWTTPSGMERCVSCAKLIWKDLGSGIQSRSLDQPWIEFGIRLPHDPQS